VCLDQIDDVVDASAVHFACGMWGLVAASLFCTKANFEAAYGLEDAQHYGAFYAPTGHGHQVRVRVRVRIRV
jgi:Amt family ammonium transporter